MKISQKIALVAILIIANVVIGLLIFNKSSYQSIVEADSDQSKTTSATLKEEKEKQKEPEVQLKDEKENNKEEKINSTEKEVVQIVEEPVQSVIEQPEIVYDGLTLEQLTAKLDRSLNSDLTGQGITFASYSLQLGIDPYLAVAIALHETGCTWECSRLVKQCNNVGGQKGSGCNGYQYFNTLDEGIRGFLDNLYYNYYEYGLTTPETMNPKYAESTEWAAKVNSYIDNIKAS